MRLAPLAVVVPLCIAAASPVRGPHVVHMVARDFFFDAPDTIDAGLVEFDMRNAGTTFHEAMLRRIPSGHTAQEVIEAIDARAPMPGWLIPSGGPDVVTNGFSSRVVQEVVAGNYIWLCFSGQPGRIPHIHRGMVRTMTVRAATRPRADEPRASATVRMNEFSFRVSGPIRAGGQWLRVNNAGEHTHEMTWFQLLPGKTMADVRALEDSGAPRPYVQLGGISPITAGQHAYVWIEPEAGHYLLLCRLTDDGSAKRHSQLGMEAEIDVRQERRRRSR
jgi:hypothetical protein